MIALSLNKTSLRWIILVGSLMMTAFIFIDLEILPPILQSEYLKSRVMFQIPTMLSLLAFTYYKDFEKYQQAAILLAITVVTYANYWLIQQSWLKAEFAFSYEGTLLYTFFAFFVVRLNFRFGIAYVLLSLLGFGVLVASYPIYGAYSSVNFGFVAMAQSICLVGLYTLTNSLKEIDNLAEKLHKLSRIDQLSGLYNRRAYEQDGHMQFEQARRLELPISVFLIDIDNFKDYNDAYGHQKGDDAIRVQAAILKSVFQRPMDVIGRFGGEEFIVIAIDMKHSAAEAMAQKIIDGWSAQHIPHGKGAAGPFLSCSIGIASIVPKKDITLTKMIGLSDVALYKAKNDGRNRYQTHLLATE
ncbi:MAG: GGDEF domain-containing protein [Oceanicoccus sp.]